MARKKMKIFAIVCDSANNGVGYYRLACPLQTAEQAGAIELKLHGFNDGQVHVPLPTMEQLEEWGKWADLLICERNDVPQYISIMCGTAQHAGIPAVISYDDNVQAVPPYNPGHPSFCPNATAKQWNIEALRRFSALIVSTQNLKDVYGAYTKNVYICPNSIDFSWRDQYLGLPPAIPKKLGEIRIGWAGSSAHWANLKYINKAVLDIMHKYPHVTLHYTGLYGGLFEDKDIQDRIHVTKFADLPDWPETLVKMGLDIAVAPLVDNLFNRAKSNLRCIEYQAAKYSVIASDVEPYRYIDDYETGILVKEPDDWFVAMEKLITDEPLRKRLALQGYEQAKKDYSMQNNYTYWTDAFYDIIKKHKRSSAA